MHLLLAPDWTGMFVPEVNLLELILRGSFIYLLLLAGFRLFRREAGSLSMADLLVVVMIANAVQNGIAGEYHSVTEAAVLAGTILVWSYVLDWLGYRFPVVHRLLQARPLLLVVDGRIQERNLRAEMLTEEDLLTQLREQGIDRLSLVRRCYLEGDGRLSVLWQGEPRKPPPRRREIR